MIRSSGSSFVIINIGISVGTVRAALGSVDAIDMRRTG